MDEEEYLRNQRKYRFANQATPPGLPVPIGRAPSTPAFPPASAGAPGSVQYKPREGGKTIGTSYYGDDNPYGLRSNPSNAFRYGDVLPPGGPQQPRRQTPSLYEWLMGIFRGGA